MSDKPKRRWYQFSLMSLIIAVLIAGAVMFISPWDYEGRMPGFNRMMNQLSVIAGGGIGLVLTECFIRRREALKP